jgi:hypothetical protein
MPFNDDQKKVLEGIRTKLGADKAGAAEPAKTYRVAPKQEEDQGAMQRRMQMLKERAEAAKERYKSEHGVDDNLNPLKK